MSTILIVEDDMLSREMLVYRLAKSGYQALQAANGFDAEEMIQCCLPDLILLDITLPDINGLDLLEKLKSDTKTSKIPILIVSGRDTNEDVIKGLELGACDYITKPYEWGIIIARVKSALRTVEVSRLLKESIYQEKVGIERKNDFLLSMSHEVLTPLNSIIGLLELLEKTPLSTEQQQYTDLMNTSSGSLQHIVNSLLDLSHLDSEEIELVNKPFNIEEVVKKVSDIIYSKACQKGLKIFLKVEDDIRLDVIGDANKITQILTNYGSNALKCTDTGTIKFTIKSHEGTELGSCYRIVVEDTGVGLSYEIQRKLFHQFIQAVPSVANKCGGAGLGLSICKKLAEALNGHVGMSSVEGEGASFWLEVPLSFDPDKNIEDNVSFKNKSILVVGDSFFCTNYSEVVNKWDAALTTSNQLPVLSSAENDYDLIITSHEDAVKEMKGEVSNMIIIHEGVIHFEDDKESTHLRAPLKPSELKNAIKKIFLN